MAFVDTSSLQAYKKEYSLEPLVVYDTLCPLCKKDLTIEEIIEGRCKFENKRFKEQKLKEDYLFLEFEQYFQKHLNKKLRTIQKLWSKRVLQGKSFSIESPPGTGKTIFGISMACFLSSHKKKSYIIVPTTSLLLQIKEKIENFFPTCKLVVYHGKLKQSEKEKALEEIKEGDYDILLTTAAFLTKNYEAVKNKFFDFVFVDDLDAVLKSSKNVDKILHLIGFSEKEIRRGKAEEGKKRGILVISTATTKQGRASNLFRNLLGFDVSQSYHTLRNVDDYYIICEEKDILSKIKEVLHILKEGGLIFAPDEDSVQHIYEALKEEFKVGVVVGNKEEDLEKFEQGEIDILIGVAKSYGKLVRGIDMPLRIRYALFYKVPGIKIYLKDIETLSDKMILTLVNTFRSHPEIKENYYHYLNNLEEAKKVLHSIFSKKEFHYANPGVVVEEDHIFYPDIRTYIQATGRTSRMYSAGITKGIAVLIDEKPYIEAFKHRAFWHEIELEEFSKRKIEESIKEVDKSRRDLLSAKESSEIIKPMIMIVESPTKAKQISRFYGKPAVNIYGNQIFYEISCGKYLLLITASLGHVVDLISKKYTYGVEVNSKIIPHYNTIKRCPSCGVQFVDVHPKCACKDIMDSKNIIENIYHLSRDVEGVIIATDPDNEGEKIGWDISNFAYVNAPVYRAEFHEVTKKAIDNALNNLKEINTNLVKSQIVRRVEDRWIGFGLSQTVQHKFKNRNLSAGRVQTPVLGWIIERYEKNKEKIEIYSLKLDNGITLSIEEDLQELKGKKVRVKIRTIKEEIKELIPLPPYSTDEVLKDINRILKISSADAMKILQTLFENGLITYHRTDSTRVSERGLSIAKEYLKEDAQLRSWGKEEGAHECIRPTKPLAKEDIYAMIKEGVISTTDKITYEHLKVYDLIFRRFMASQCKPYKQKVKTLEIDIENKKITKEIVYEYEGKAYDLYPYVGIPLHIEDGEFTGEIKSYKVSKYPLYTESDIIALMKSKKIGRPSTYAVILQKLYKRGYIAKKNNKLVPTSKGIKVYQYLINNYKDFVSEETTRKMEEILDEIENGKKDYIDVLHQLYQELETLLHLQM